jgi:hypothetical protein
MERRNIVIRRHPGCAGLCPRVGACLEHRNTVARLGQPRSYGAASSSRPYNDILVFTRHEVYPVSQSEGCKCELMRGNGFLTPCTLFKHFIPCRLVQRYAVHVVA